LIFWGLTIPVVPIIRKPVFFTSRSSIQNLIYKYMTRTGIYIVLRRHNQRTPFSEAAPLSARQLENSSSSPMSKRSSSKVTLPKQRKRRRNGISMHSEVLEPPSPTSPPNSVGTMPIQHTNVGNPKARITFAAMPSSPKPPVERTIQFEERFEDAFHYPGAPPKAAARRKRKRRNDSVSPFCSTRYCIYS
jgi:hypothetical protein